MEIIQRKLDNGIPVVLIPMEGFYNFVQFCAVGGGGRYESAKRSGISHLLEHMMFKGTKRRPSARQIATDIANMGGSSNAYTTEEEIAFYVHAPGKFFAEVTDILADQMQNSLLVSEEIEKEKLAVYEEIGMRQSEPMMAALDMLPGLIYGDQAAGRDVAGTRETVDAITRRQLASYMNRFFNRSNMVVVVAGNIPDEKEALNILNEHYRNIPDTKTPRKYVVRNTRQLEAEVLLKQKDLPQSSIALAVRSPSDSSELKPALKLMSVILGGGMSSRLFSEVREKRGLAYNISSGLNLSTDTGNLIIYGGITPSRLFEALEVIREELRKLATEEVSAEELSKAKNLIEAGTFSTMESPDNLANYAASEALHYGYVTHPSLKVDAFKNVTAEDIRQLAEDMFVNKNLNLVVIGPHVAQDREDFVEAISF